MVRTIFPRTRNVALGLCHADGWERLVFSYFVAAPPREFSFLGCCKGFPSHVHARAEPMGLPPWLSEAADFELSERSVGVAHWQTGSPPGRLRLNPTVDLRLYGFDLVGWALNGERGEPVKRPSLVIFWQDHRLSPRYTEVGQRELNVLRAAYHGGSVPQGGRTASVVRELCQAGILIP